MKHDAFFVSVEMKFYNEVFHMKQMKKITALCLIFVLLLSCLSIGVSAASAHFEPPKRLPLRLSGDLASDIFAVAESQVGYTEDVFGRTCYGDWWTDVVSGKEFDDPWKGKIDIDCAKADWCSIFICWAMEQAGAEYGCTYNVLSGTVDYFFQLLKVGGANIYTPEDKHVRKMGDLVFYSYDGGRTLGHVAITDGNDNYIHANYANAVVKNKGDLVFKISDEINYSPVYIVSPNYELNKVTGDSKIINAVMLFESTVLALPGRLSNEIMKIFDTDDETGYEPPKPPVYVDEVIPGDADRDGEVTPADARMILRAAVGLDKLSAEQMKRADLNNDGECTVDEARTVLRAAVGLEAI